MIENENLIRNHESSVLMLSDASSLQLIQRGKTSNTIFAELGCLISSFGNLGVFYCLGSALFLPDLFSRSFNKVLLKNGSNISKEFEQLLPALPKYPNQTILTPEQVNDFLLFTAPAERLDVFPLYREYSQITSRYHTLNDFKRFDNQIYPEIDLLASLYTGFNGKSLTQQTLQEINERLAKFPASSLATKSKNPSLNKLRQKLTELDLHTEFMAVLARKYNLQNPNSTEKMENGHKIPLNDFARNCGKF